MNTWARFWTVQFFVHCMALPILIAWGLPFSLLAPLGTLLFGPVLSVYLVCAVCVFVTSCIPLAQSFFVTILDYISWVWLWALGMVQHPLSIGFVQPHIFVLVLIPVVALTVLWYMRMYAEWVRAVVLGALFLCICSGLRYTYTVSATDGVLVHNGATLSYAVVDGTVVCVDHDGVLSRSASADNWFTYHGMPNIIAHTGCDYINHFVVVHPRQRTFEALAQLCERMCIGTVYVPWWDGKLSRNAWRAYVRMREALHKHGGKLFILNNKTTIALPSSNACILMPTDKIGNYHDATYTIFATTYAEHQKKA